MYYNIMDWYILGIVLGIPYFVYIGPTCLKGVNHHDKFMSISEKVFYEYAGKTL